MTSHDWGRVDDDGTVYLTAPDGERAVGQVPDVPPEEALAFFTRRFDALEFEVGLLEQRVRSAAMTPEEASESVKTVRGQVVGANAVGDLDALAARLDALGGVIAEQREARKVERAQRVAESKVEKEKLVAEAERISAGTDWRGGAGRMREILDAWKALPRLDRASDDALWRRFSSARTTYTRRRKAHFSEQTEKRAGAQAVKEGLVAQAEALSGSTDWGETARAYRDLMRDWKAAGLAPRHVDDALWKRFRAAQDTFFGARDAELAAQDAEFSANATVKEGLLAEAEALDPASDLDAAKAAYRSIAERWEAAGKVPRDRMKELEGRIRKVEQAIRSAEDDQWRRTDPEKSARADDMVSKFEAAISALQADLDKATAAGDASRAAQLQQTLTSQQAFLDMARRASQEFSG